MINEGKVKQSKPWKRRMLGEGKYMSIELTVGYGYKKKAIRPDSLFYYICQESQPAPPM